jgi:hypothetical protein
LSKKQAIAGKNPSVKNEHLFTAGHVKNINLIWKKNASAPYPYVSPPLSTKQATFWKTQ